MSASNETQLRLAALQGYCSVDSPTYLQDLNNLVLDIGTSSPGIKGNQNEVNH